MKQLAPAAILALKNALRLVFWRKKDLKDFFNLTIGRIEVMSLWDNNLTKAECVDILLNYMLKNRAEYEVEIQKLIVETHSFNDFSHLASLEDGFAKVRDAEAALKALKNYAQFFQEAKTNLEDYEKRKLTAEKSTETKNIFTSTLASASEDFKALWSSADAQARGYKLEKILVDLFKLFGLDPRASFRLIGEQVDGAFTFDGTDYLIEAKWQKLPVSAADLDVFSQKVDRKLKNTLGLLVSINGFQNEGIESHSYGIKRILLMDGMHLTSILEGRIRLDEILLRMRRHASETGQLYLPAGQVWA